MIGGDKLVWAVYTTDYGRQYSAKIVERHYLEPSLGWLPADYSLPVLTGFRPRRVELASADGTQHTYVRVGSPDAPILDVPEATVELVGFGGPGEPGYKRRFWPEKGPLLPRQPSPP